MMIVSPLTGVGHWHSLERLVPYLRGTASYGVHNVGYPRVLEGYVDSTGYTRDANELKDWRAILIQLDIHVMLMSLRLHLLVTLFLEILVSNPS